MKLKKKNKRHNGFTLLEVIVSLGALSLMSIFILDMFLVSSRANLRAKNKDIASAMAMSSIELFKSGFDAYDFIFSDFVHGAHIKIGEGGNGKEFIYEREQAEKIDFTETVTIYKYFSKDFNYLPDTMQSDPTVAIDADYIGYYQVFIIYSKTMVDGYTYDNSRGELENAGEIFNIRTYFMDVNAEPDKSQLVSYSSKKYFAYR